MSNGDATGVPGSFVELVGTVDGDVVRVLVKEPPPVMYFGRTEKTLDDLSILDIEWVRLQAAPQIDCSGLPPGCVPPPPPPLASAGPIAPGTRVRHKWNLKYGTLRGYHLSDPQTAVVDADDGQRYSWQVGNLEAADG